MGTGVSALAFSPGGVFIAAGLATGSVNVYRVDDGRQILALNLGDPIASVDFSIDGLLLACAATTVTLFHVPDGEKIRIFDTSFDEINVARFSPDGSEFLAGGSSYLYRLKSGTGELLRVIPVPSVRAISHNLAKFASFNVAQYSRPNPGSFFIGDANSGQILSDYQGESHSTVDVQFSADDTEVLARSSAGALRFWVVVDSQQAPTPTPFPVPTPTAEKIRDYLLGRQFIPAGLDANGDSQIDISDLLTLPPGP